MNRAPGPFLRSMMAETPLPWHLLNDALREADEFKCRALELAEKAGPNRARHLTRIAQRMNKIKTDLVKADFEKKLEQIRSTAK